MSGGIAYVYDVDGNFDRKCNKEMVELLKVDSDKDDLFLRNLLKDFADETGSEVAKNILNDWSSAKGSFVKVFPYEYQRALKEMEEKAEDTCAKKKEEAEEEEPEVADIESVVKDADMIKRKAEIVLDKTRGFVKYK